jgi:Putative peptidoglycan binding domain
VTLLRVSIESPCWSSRGGAAVRLIVCHTSEGAQTYQSLGSYFQNDANQVSSHVGIDDTPNTIGQYVQRGNKAWTSANANPVAVQAELCTPSGAAQGWTANDWNQHEQMLRNTAAWIAEEAATFGIPIVKLTAQQAQGGETGVCQHADLGAWGGGHTDCGNAFPIDQVLSWAKGGGGTPTPPPPPSGKGPAFPYGQSDYLGQPSPDPHCHSGYYGGPDQQNVRTWQQQMQARNWQLDTDGQYGPDSERVCRQFQANKGLPVDGLVGPSTWATTWNSPVGE